MALKPWLRTLSSERVNQKSELLTKTMMEFQMTVVQESEDDIIDKIWAGVSEEKKIIDKAEKKYDVCGEENQALWYLGRLPLIVTVDDDNSGKVECAVHLLGRCAGDKKVILVGKVTRDDFPEWRTFETLADILTTYDEVVTTFNVSLQGRAPIPLQRLIQCDKEVKDIVTVKELLEMAQNEYLSIGSLPITNLPEVYIPRVVSSPEEELSSIKEEDIFRYFNDNLNIFCAPPGMGKTTLFQVLSSKYCPSHFWCFYVTLINCNVFLRNRPSKQQILDHFCQVDESEEDFVSKIRNLLIRNRKVHLFLDGVDELETVSQNLLLSFVEYVSSDNIRVWVSARASLQQKICQKLDKKSLVIEELHKDQQRNYIYDRLVKTYEEDELQKILDVVFDSSDVTNSRQLLAIPLQLYIITEMFHNNRDAYENLNKENIFVLTKMYKLFFDGKKRFSYGKLGMHEYDYQLGTSFEHHLKQYEVLGLKSCLEHEHFQRLAIDPDSYNDYFVQIKENGEKFGIILKIDTDDQIVFNHQTYAEYFACVWFKSHPDKIRLLCREVFSVRYDNLKRIFDIMMAERNPLHLAIIYKNMEQFGKHIDDDKCDEGGRTALHIACTYGNKCPGKGDYFAWTVISRETTNYKDSVDVLVRKNDKILEKDRIFDFNCFDYSLISRCLYPVEKMLQLKKLHPGDLVKIYDYFDQESLVWSCAQLGYPSLFQALIQSNGLDVNDAPWDFGLLGCAVRGCYRDAVGTPREGNIAVIDFLLNNGVNVHQVDTSKKTILDYACEHQCYDMLKILVDRGAKCSEGNTILHNIAKHSVNFADIVEEFNINVNTQNENGETALHCAFDEGSVENVVQLFNLGADFKILTNQKKSMLHFAALSSESRDEKMDLLIKKGIDVNIVDGICGSVLHYIVRLWKVDDVKQLLSNHKFDVNVPNEEKETPIHVACKSDSSADMVKMLIDFGADVNVVDRYGRSPIHSVLGSRTDKEQKMELLIEHGALINAQDRDGKTVLHHMPSKEVLKKFLEAGADVNVVDNSGSTALHVATGVLWNRKKIELLGIASGIWF